jgi:hypothetical protein
MEAQSDMTDIETTGAAGEAEDSTQWLAGPPPPPPDRGAAGEPGPPGGGTAEGDTVLPTHSPLSRSGWSSSAAQVRAESPWMLASAGVLVALAAYWIASIARAFQHGHHITAQERALRVFVPGSLIWVLGAILAVALYAAGRRFEVPPARSGPLRSTLAMALVLSSAAAVASSAMSFIVELANFGNGIATTVAGLIGYAGTLVLAGALAFWANREHEASAGGGP